MQLWKEYRELNQDRFLYQLLAISKKEEIRNLRGILEAIDCANRVKQYIKETCGYSLIAEIEKGIKINQWIFFLKEQLKELFNGTSARGVLDKRKHFRSIIKFIFKNMDDESNELNVLNNSISKTFYNSLINYSNEQRRNDSLYKDYSK